MAFRSLCLLGAVAFCFVGCGATLEPSAGRPMVVYASQSGGATLDNGEGGGNPFASALVELLEEPTVDIADLVDLTKKKSRGFQIPEVAPAGLSARFTRAETLAGSEYQALVLVYSDYDKTEWSSLPGADRDRKRVAAALRKKGFAVEESSNPTREALRASLERLAERSKAAKVALLYVTGHGCENNEQVYLLPNDFPSKEFTEETASYALEVESMQAYLLASDVNLVLYGGCRTYK
ncbi:MAG: caspase family protein [Candidatus Eisenbacteria bacterium]|uniref:Caspase family protein n=1 Tax=Eiseniibacteriota bacterium TaxID=2212470 RepID=A0A7Y2EC60_UNCEI|nr:caspase family protein [Candidatus Eisenbacteria bacterium]